MDVVELARSGFVRQFRWTNGHADFAGVLRDGELLAQLGAALAAPFAGRGTTTVVALEARGFVLGALCARELGVGLVLARKAGAVHPGEKVEVVSAPDWRGRQVTIQPEHTTLGPLLPTARQPAPVGAASLIRETGRHGRVQQNRLAVRWGPRARVRVWPNL